MLQSFGLFFIFFSVIVYISALVLGILFTIKTGVPQWGILKELNFYHFTFIAGIVLNFPILKGFDFNLKKFFSFVLEHNKRSIPFLLFFQAFFLIWGFISGALNPLAILQALILLSLFLHYKLNRQL